MNSISPSAKTTSLSLILYGMSTRTTPGQIEALFSKYKPLVRCTMLSKSQSGSSQKCAIIEANSTWQRDSILQRSYSLHGRYVFCQEYSQILLENIPEESDSEPGKVIFKKLRPSISQKSLRNYLSEYGDLIYCYIAKSRNQKSKKFGFARFRDPRIAELLAAKGVLSLEGHEFTVKIFEERKINKGSKIGRDRSRTAFNHADQNMRRDSSGEGQIGQENQNGRRPLKNGYRDQNEREGTRPCSGKNRGSELLRNHHIFDPKNCYLNHEDSNLGIRRSGEP